MRNINRGDRLRTWLLTNVPRSMHWRAYTGQAMNNEKNDALSDLHDVLTQNSVEEIAAYFSKLKSELEIKAIAADIECEDHPVPKGWPEPTD